MELELIEPELFLGFTPTLRIGWRRDRPFAGVTR